MVFKIFGDAHLGRVFKTNVALHRRGEYEKKQMDTFKGTIICWSVRTENPTGYLKVQVGDLFDKAVVSNQVVLDTIKLLQIWRKRPWKYLHYFWGTMTIVSQLQNQRRGIFWLNFSMEVITFVCENLEFILSQINLKFYLWVGIFHPSVAQAYLEAEKEVMTQMWLFAI